MPDAEQEEPGRTREERKKNIKKDPNKLERSENSKDGT